MKKLVLLLALTAATVKADIGQDKYWHFGTVYAIQMVSYGITDRVFQMDKTDTVILSSFLTGMVWFTKEMLDAQQSQRIDIGDIGANALGQAAAVGTIFVFDF